MEPYVTIGRTGFWQHPVSVTRALRDLDALAGVWIGARDEEVVPGLPCPAPYGGMVVETAVRELGAAHSKWRISARGNEDGNKLEKLVRQGRKHSVEGTWDEVTREVMTWNGQKRACTGASATNLITCPGHCFHNGDTVGFLEMTGSNLVKNFPYYVRDLGYAGGPFKVATTSGGSAVSLGTNMTAGELLAWDYCPGAAHPSLTNMYLRDVQESDELQGWTTLSLGYAGLYGTKRAYRTVSVDGRVVSNDNMYFDFPGSGGWTEANAQKGQGMFPEVTIDEVTVEVGEQSWLNLPISDVLNTLGEVGRVVPDEAVLQSPPDINADYGVVAGPDVYRSFPCLWSFVNKRVVAQIPGTEIRIIQRTWKYVYPYTF